MTTLRRMLLSTAKETLDAQKPALKKKQKIQQEDCEETHKPKKPFKKRKQYAPSPPLPISSPEIIEIPELETRMLPHGPIGDSLISTLRDFDLTNDLHAYRLNQENVKLTLKSGQRSGKQALSEYKTIKTNERWNSDDVEIWKKLQKKNAEQEDEPCQCNKSNCDVNCINRSLQIECNPKLCPVELRTPGSCRNMRISKGCKRKIEVKAVDQKGVGLFALEKIPAGSFVNEYVGEIIEEKECARRLANEYIDEKHKYLMCMNGGFIIDATRKGNVARFINHSCDPNCIVQEWRVRGEPRMGIFTIKDVEIGEELSFNYNFQRFGEYAQQCFCGSSNCVGWLGRSNDTEAESLLKNLKPRVGYDPVLNDNVGVNMDDSSFRRTENFILELLETSMPKNDRERASEECVFLVRNVQKSLQEIFNPQVGKFGW